ncbi:hypothetical protein QQ045_006911 [Rhodiola kirilowii]
MTWRLISTPFRRHLVKPGVWRTKQVSKSLLIIWPWSILSRKVTILGVKDGGPWLCLGTVVLMHEWCPNLTPEEFFMNRLIVWAQLHNLSIEVVLNDKEIGGKLAANIEKFVRTNQSELEEPKRKYIRIKVEIDILKPIVKGFYLNRPNREPLWVSVLPNVCSSCESLSHEGIDCDSLEPCIGFRPYSEPKAISPKQNATGHASKDVVGINISTFGMEYDRTEPKNLVTGGRRRELDCRIDSGKP